MASSNGSAVQVAARKAPRSPAPAKARARAKTSASRAPEHKVAVLFHGRLASSSDLRRPVAENLIEQLGGVCCQGERQTDSRIDIWLDSPGGDAHAAYKLGLFLASRFETINFVIPDYAKSAATLLSLVGDSIYMSNCAELGPLDMQHTREGEMQTRSAISTADSIEFLFQHAFDNALHYGGHVMQATKLSREQSVSQMLQFAAQLFQPLITQLDPIAIHAAATGLLVTIEYGTRLMQLKHPGMSDAEAGSIVARLVRDYPVHGFIIDRSEAESLHLPVKSMADYPYKAAVESLYVAWRRVGNDTIRVLDKTEVEQLNSDALKSGPEKDEGDNGT